MAEKINYIDYKKYDFDIGDPMLCYYGTMLYQATCINRRYSKKYGVEYKVHYEGWKKFWDEWLQEERVIEVNETNLAHLERVETNHEDKLKKAKVLSRCFNGVIPTKKVVQQPRKRGRPPKRKYKNTKRVKTSNSSTVTEDVADTSDDDDDDDVMNKIDTSNNKTKVDTITIDNDIVITRSPNTGIATETNNVASTSRPPKRKYKNTKRVKSSNSSTVTEDVADTSDDDDDDVMNKIDTSNNKTNVDTITIDDDIVITRSPNTGIATETNNVASTSRQPKRKYKNTKRVKTSYSSTVTEDVADTSDDDDDDDDVMNKIDTLNNKTKVDTITIDDDIVITRSPNTGIATETNNVASTSRPPKRKYKNTKRVKTSNYSMVTEDVADTSDDDDVMNKIDTSYNKTKVDTITIDDDIIITRSPNTGIATETNNVTSTSRPPKRKYKNTKRVKTSNSSTVTDDETDTSDDDDDDDVMNKIDTSNNKTKVDTITIDDDIVITRSPNTGIATETNNVASTSRPPKRKYKNTKRVKTSNSSTVTEDVADTSDDDDDDDEDDDDEDDDDDDDDVMNKIVTLNNKTKVDTITIDDDIVITRSPNTGIATETNNVASTSRPPKRKYKNTKRVKTSNSSTVTEDVADTSDDDDDEDDDDEDYDDDDDNDDDDDDVMNKIDTSNNKTNVDTITIDDDIVITRSPNTGIATETNNVASTSRLPKRKYKNTKRVKTSNSSTVTEDVADTSDDDDDEDDDDEDYYDDDDDNDDDDDDVMNKIDTSNNKTNVDTITIDDDIVITRSPNTGIATETNNVASTSRPPKRKYKKTKRVKTSNSSTVTEDVADTSDDDDDEEDDDEDYDDEDYDDDDDNDDDDDDVMNKIDTSNNNTKVDTITIDDDIVITRSSNTGIATETNNVASTSNCSTSNINNELSNVSECITQTFNNQNFIYVYPRSMHICKMVSCFNISCKLRLFLVYDWMMNNYHKKVVKTRSNVSVGAVVCDYVESKIKEGCCQILRDKVAAFGLSVLEHFNQMIIKHLLHKYELQNNVPRKALDEFRKNSSYGNERGLFYAHLLTEKKVWCYIYGATHLLRLFVDMDYDIDGIPTTKKKGH